MQDSRVYTLTTKFEYMDGIEQAKKYQHQTPLKQWKTDADNSTLATLNLHRSFSASSDSTKLLAC